MNKETIKIINWLCDRLEAAENKIKELTTEC